MDSNRETARHYAFDTGFIVDQHVQASGLRVFEDSRRVDHGLLVHIVSEPYNWPPIQILFARYRPQLRLEVPLL